MNLRLKISFIIVSFLFSFQWLRAEQLLDKDRKAEIITGLTEGWNSWERVSLNGKFKMEGLPLSPSMKIFMIRDSLIVISLRAPLMGEVGRAEITQDSVLMVNKMKKTYFKEPTNYISAFYQGSLSELQDLILRRPVLAGFGNLAEADAELIEIYEDAAGDFSLIPGDGALAPMVSYGYLISSDLKPEVLLVIPESNPEINVLLNFSDRKNGYQIEAVYESPDINEACILELDNPEWEKGEISLLNIKNNYRRLSPADFIKSF